MNKAQERTSKSIARQLEKFERAAHELRELADKVHRKTEEMHMEAHATRVRARAVGKKAEGRSIVRRRRVS